MKDVFNESNVMYWVLASPDRVEGHSVAGPLPKLCSECDGHLVCAKCGGSGGGMELPLACTACEGTGACPTCRPPYREPRP